MTTNSSRKPLKKVATEPYQSRKTKISTKSDEYLKIDEVLYKNHYNLYSLFGSEHAW